jgi:hypothetical protein
MQIMALTDWNIWDDKDNGQLLRPDKTGRQASQGRLIIRVRHKFERVFSSPEKKETRSIILFPLGHARWRNSHILFNIKFAPYLTEETVERFVSF